MGDPKAACRIAVLDPRLTVTQPAGVTALTGVDALAHALETYVTKRRNSVSLAFSREAWRLLAGNFTRVLDDPEELEARGAMQLGASFAGLAIENSMLGAAHALANPLTARYGTVHGQAVGIMLPHVIRFNGEQFADWYVDLLEASGHQAGIPHPKVGPEGLADFVTELVAHSGLHTRLSDCAVDQADFDELAEDAASQWTGTFNPRHVEAGSLRHLYEQAF